MKKFLHSFYAEMGYERTPLYLKHSYF